MLRSMKETQGVDLEAEDEEGEEGDDDDEEGMVVLGGDEEEEGEEGVGSIHIRNSQRSVALDLGLLQRQLRAVLEIVGRADHDVSLWLTNDRSIREYNDRYRGVRRATDILSFPFHEYAAPEKPTPESLTLNGAVRDLGDMMVSVAYVQRACERDLEELTASGENHWWEERGASGAMSRLFGVQARLPYLAIHGVLHLLGYDHETEADYTRMVAQEERVIAQFLKRFPEAAPPAPQALLGELKLRQQKRKPPAGAGAGAAGGGSRTGGPKKGKE
jgi:rRNA maturation RNase YbeY